MRAVEFTDYPGTRCAYCSGDASYNMVFQKTRQGVAYTTGKRVCEYHAKAFAQKHGLPMPVRDQAAVAPEAPNAAG